MVEADTRTSVMRLLIACRPNLASEVVALGITHPAATAANSEIVSNRSFIDLILLCRLPHGSLVAGQRPGCAGDEIGQHPRDREILVEEAAANALIRK